MAPGKIINFGIHNGQAEQVDLFQGLDLLVLDWAAQLGAGDPLLVLGFTSTSP